MPSYEYQCACGYRETLSHAMGETVVIECTYCLVPLVRRLTFSASRFDGNGWASKE